MLLKFAKWIPFHLFASPRYHRLFEQLLGRCKPLCKRIQETAVFVGHPVLRLTPKMNAESFCVSPPVLLTQPREWTMQTDVSSVLRCIHHMPIHLWYTCIDNALWSFFGFLGTCKKRHQSTIISPRLGKNYQSRKAGRSLWAVLTHM